MLEKKRKSKLLLHICCVGCGVAIMKELKGDYQLTLYFYNPNIFPKEEYNKRLMEAKRIASELGLDLIAEDYNHKSWLKLVRGYEKDPERGERCRICYKDRLKQTAAKAKELGFDSFTTTLTVSPHKDAKAIITLGNDLVNKYSLKFLDQDFKKQDGFKKACALSKELNLYRQEYCGCEFSMK
ncbi:epoxyqueuosine reductase QueH [Candidatus Parcubacteria bacterium]|nr:epoxyqueuosine reductase QueH [Candidatus Parcubacteria bacterium]